MKNYKLLFLVFIIGLMVFAAVPAAKTEFKPYYDGEAAAFNDQVVFATTNRGIFELLKLENDKIRRVATIISDDSQEKNFKDCALLQEGNRLFAYLVNGKYFYKYDISDHNRISLVGKAKDNKYDYFYGVAAAGDNVVTIGSNGLKIWNTDMQTTNAFDQFYKYPNSVAMSDDGEILCDTLNNKLTCVDVFHRNIILEKSLVSEEEHSMRPFIDTLAGLVYIVDDRTLRQYSLGGHYIAFQHASNMGYDVDGVDDSNHVYFSDGIGIVKAKKTDLSAVKWVHTTNLAGENGWAMSLRAVKDSQGEKVIVFNNSSILAFDENLNLLDSYRPAESAAETADAGKLFLAIDRNFGFTGSTFTLSGGGFGPGELLDIRFAGYALYAKTNNNGQFNKVITVPEIQPSVQSIKVTGFISNKTYSISFEVK